MAPKNSYFQEHFSSLNLMLFQRKFYQSGTSTYTLRTSVPVLYQLKLGQTGLRVYPGRLQLVMLFFGPCFCLILLFCHISCFLLICLEMFFYCCVVLLFFFLCCCCCCFCRCCCCLFLFALLFLWVVVYVAPNVLLLSLLLLSLFCFPPHVNY